MKNNCTPIKIILADDHPLVCECFRLMFENIEGYNVIGKAANGEELVNLARELKPDIIITDVVMPVKNGIEAAKQLTEELPSIGIIALSMLSDAYMITDMLAAGAKGYLIKDIQVDEMIVAVDAVFNGGTYYCKGSTAELIKILATDDYKLINKKNAPKFSEKEIEIIKLIRKGCTYKEIAKQIHLSRRTIEWHRNEIIVKLGLKTNADIIAYAIKNNIH